MTQQPSEQQSEQQIVLTVDQLTDVLAKSHHTRSTSITTTIMTISSLVTAVFAICGGAAVFLSYIQDKSQNSATDDALKFSELDSMRMAQLHKQLDTYFSKEDLQTLCLFLDVDYEDIEGEGQAEKARELVEFFARREKLDLLHKAMIAERPFLADEPTAVRAIA